jgi:hypothetical protein
MRKEIALEVLTLVETGRELGSRLNGTTFDELIRREFVAYADGEWMLTDAGRAYLTDARASAKRARDKRNASAKASRAMLRSFGLRRTADGWE